MKLIALLLVADLVPTGYEFDAKSWQKGTRDKVRVTLVTTTGQKNVGMFELAGDADPLDLQIGLVESLKQRGWETHYGPEYTVVVFPPPGQSIKSIQIESKAWVPKYRRIPAPFPLPKK